MSGSNWKRGVALAWWIIMLATLALRVDAAPYQKLSTEVPPYLPPGVKDSTLVVWGPPVQLIRTKVNLDRSESVIWMRITVGAGGRAVHSEAVYASDSDLDLKQAAKDAVRDALFYAVWDGPNAVEYDGYYPVVFTTQKSNWWLHLADRKAFDNYKEISKSVGRDAPVVIPTTPLAVKWPSKLKDSISEVTAWVKARISATGKVQGCSAVFFLERLSEFDKAAVKAVQNATFPVKRSENRVLTYDAYVPVAFVHSPGEFHKLGFPEPDEITGNDWPPVVVDSPTSGILPELDKAGIHGSVGMRLLIGTNGQVLTARVDSGSGFLELDQLALVRARTLHFSPASRDGAPLAAWTTVRLNFAPNEDRQMAAHYLNVGMHKADSTNLPVPGEFMELERVPEVIKEIGAEYPRSAKIAGQTGEVVVWALVDKSGKVIECRIAKSSGYESLNNSAVAALSRFQFTPGIQDGKPVKCWISKKFKFSLK